MNEILTPYILESASKNEIRVALVAAVILQESNGNPWASRYEPIFYDRYLRHLGRSTMPGFIPPSDMVDILTEKHHRATSWGSMQCMGETAREAGYMETELVKLLVPAIGIKWGCKILANCLKKAGGDERKALLFWNGGGNSLYPDKVFDRIDNNSIDLLLQPGN
jgi:soluble lytic murein transglycosylase-like protein